MKDLPLRTLVAFALLTLLGLVIWLGGWVEAAVLGLFSAVAVYEMQGLFNEKDIHPFVIPLLILGAGMFAVLYALGRLWFAGLFFLAFLAIAFERIFNKNRTNSDVAASLTILVYPLALFACFGLIGFGREDYSRLALLCIIVSVCLSDTFAYFVGSMLGRHKLCPAISPKKSVEGAVGGLIGGALGGVIVYFAQKLWSFPPASLPLLIGVCFLAGLVGQFGDLFSSTFKRWAGIKDFGKIFPGHGGIMDRVDSALFAAPVVFFAMQICVKLNWLPAGFNI
jgi:CDP-diglyceride synthetase